MERFQLSTSMVLSPSPQVHLDTNELILTPAEEDCHFPAPPPQPVAASLPHPSTGGGGGNSHLKGGAGKVASPPAATAPLPSNAVAASFLPPRRGVGGSGGSALVDAVVPKLAERHRRKLVRSLLLHGDVFSHR